MNKQTLEAERLYNKLAKEFVKWNKCREFSQCPSFYKYLGSTVFNINENFTKEELTKSFREIISKIHPDRHQNNSRFNDLTQCVIAFFHSIIDEIDEIDEMANRENHKKNSAKSKRQETPLLMIENDGEIFVPNSEATQNYNLPGEFIHPEEQNHSHKILVRGGLRAYVYQDQTRTVSLKALGHEDRENVADFFRNNKNKIKSGIAIDGAEHTKNKTKKKADKHQKGLRQRAVQKKNAERRIQNHLFSFTNNFEINLDKPSFTINSTN